MTPARSRQTRRIGGMISWADSPSFASVMLAKARRENMTLRDLYNLTGAARGHWVLCGTPETVADTLEQWFTEYAADGFNILPPYFPGAFADFVDQVVDETSADAAKALKPIAGELAFAVFALGIVGIFYIFKTLDFDQVFAAAPSIAKGGSLSRGWSVHSPRLLGK